MQAAHAAAEAERVKTAELREELAAERAATMQETIKRMEAEKATLEERNKHLEGAAKAEAAKAEAAKDAAEEDADADGLGEGGGSSKSAADAITEAMKKNKKADLGEQCTFPRDIPRPEWPTFDPSVKFDETNALYVDGHVRALAWRKVWQAIKEHFEAARDGYAHAMHNTIMKVRISPLEKGEAENDRHLFYDGAKGKGFATVNPLNPDLTVNVNASAERAAHAERVHQMVVHTFTEFLNMMVFENARNAKQGNDGEYVRWRPTSYSHACVVREIREAIAAGATGPAMAPFMDGKLPPHTDATSTHSGDYGIVQRRAKYLQLIGLDYMHVMVVKALELQLAIVLKKVLQSHKLKTTVNNQASVLHTAVPAKGLPRDYDANDDPTTDPPTMGVGGAPLSYTFAAPGTAALRVLDRRFDANGPFSAIMLLVKSGRVGADSTSLESSLQDVADYDTEVRLFFTLPDGTLDRAEMDRAKGLADVLLAVPAAEAVLFDTLTDMIASHSPMARTADKLRQYIIDRMSSHGLRPGMKQEAYMAQTHGPMAMSAQHAPTAVYSPAGFVSMAGAQGYGASQPVQQSPHVVQHVPQSMQQAHMVQQAHDMQRALQEYALEGDDFVDAFGAAQRRRVQCSNCNTYENMLKPPRGYVPHDTLDCPLKCNMCEMAPPKHLGPADNERRCIRFDGWQRKLEQRPAQRPPQQQQQQRQGGGRSADYSQRGITGARKSGRASRLREGASEAVVCRLADFDVELARMASAAIGSLDDPTKLAEIDTCYDSTFHMREELVHMANTSGAGP